MQWETTDKGACYLRVSEGKIARTADYGAMDVWADITADGTLVGLEFLGGQAHVMAGELGAAG